MANEIVIAWQWNDGTRCVLGDDGSDQLELRVVRGAETLRRVPVIDVAIALSIAARELEVELLSERTPLIPEGSPSIAMVTEP